MSIEFTFTPDFNQTATVQPDGFITLREVGDMYVQGQTVPQLTDTLKKAYSKILNNPEIAVVPKDFQKPHFTVGGQVGHPGRYELREDTTVSEAVQVAGGLLPSAKHSRAILFRRVSQGWFETKVLDLKSILDKGNYREDVQLQPGDMLYVPKNRFSKIAPFIEPWAVASYFPKL